MKLSVFNRGMEVNGLQYSVSLLFEYDILYMLKFIMKPMNGVNIANSRHNKKKTKGRGEGGSEFTSVRILFSRKDYMLMTGKNR